MNSQLTAVCVVALSFFWVIGCYIDAGLAEARAKK